MTRRTVWVLIGLAAVAAAGAVVRQMWPGAERGDTVVHAEVATPFARALPLELGEDGSVEVTGRPSAAGHEAMFRFDVAGSGLLQAWLTPAGDLDAGVYLYDAARLPAGQGSGSQLASLSVMPGARIYVKVTTRRGTPGRYTLRLTVARDDRREAPPDLSSARLEALVPSGSTVLTGHIGDAARGDALRFKAARDGLMVVEVQPAPGSKLSAGVAAFDRDRRPLTLGHRRIAEFVTVAGGSYYLKVDPKSSSEVGWESTGAYKLLMHTDPIAADDYGDDFAGAHEVMVDANGSSVRGRIELPGDQDCFRLLPQTDGLLVVERGQDAQGEQLNLNWRAFHSDGLPFDTGLTLKAGQTYYVKVWGEPSPNLAQRSTGDYRIRFGLTTRPVARPEVDLKALAVLIPAKGVKMQAGILSNAGDFAWFEFKPPYTGDFKVTLQPSAGSIIRGRLSIYDENKALVSEDASSPKQTVQFRVDKGRRYYVKVATPEDAPASQRSGSYSLKFERDVK